MPTAVQIVGQNHAARADGNYDDATTRRHDEIWVMPRASGLLAPRASRGWRDADPGSQTALNRRLLVIPDPCLSNAGPACRRASSPRARDIGVTLLTGGPFAVPQSLSCERPLRTNVGIRRAAAGRVVASSRERVSATSWTVRTAPNVAGSELPQTRRSGRVGGDLS